MGDRASNVPLNANSAFGQALLAEARAKMAAKEVDSDRAEPKGVVITSADKRAGLGAQRAAEALAAGVPLIIEREASTLQYRLEKLRADPSIESVSGADHAAIKLQRERIIRGEVKIV